MSARKRGLGRGLDALLGGGAAPLAAEAPAQEGNLRELPVDKVQRGRYQPRTDLHPEALEDLANSIRSQGVVQPIVVRPLESGNFEIIAGERRWRASQLAGLDRIPAVVRDVPDQAAMAIGLIENIQRENLNPMEEANALNRLIEEFGLTHQQVAEAVGRSRVAVSNLLRLRELAGEVKLMLERGDLEMGHARALLALEIERQGDAARHVVGRGLSVRETEALVRRWSEGGGVKPRATRRLDPNVSRLQDEMSERLGAPVRLSHGPKGRGKVVIQYNSLDELEGILAHIK